MLHAAYSMQEVEEVAPQGFLCKNNLRASVYLRTKCGLRTSRAELASYVYELVVNGVEP